MRMTILVNLFLDLSLPETQHPISTKSQHHEKNEKQQIVLDTACSLWQFLDCICYFII